MFSTYRHITFQANSFMKSQQEVKAKLLNDLKLAITDVQDIDSQGVNSEHDGKESHVRYLCHILDKTFSHGLNNEKDGYWVFIKCFLHTDSLTSINSLINVKTNSGKGRAWLCMTLNENNLESYIFSIINNASIVNKYFSAQAFLRDFQSVELFQMLVSGLEYIKFDLYLDTSYLDLPTAFKHCGNCSRNNSISNLSKSSDSSSNQFSLGEESQNSMDGLVAEAMEFKSIRKSSESIIDETALEVLHHSAKVKRKRLKSTGARRQSSNSPKESPTETNCGLTTAAKMIQDVDFHSIISENNICAADFEGKVESSGDIEINHNVEKIQRDMRWKFHIAESKKLAPPVCERGVPEGQEDPPIVVTPSGNKNVETEVIKLLDCDESCGTVGNEMKECLLNDVESVTIRDSSSLVESNDEVNENFYDFYSLNKSECQNKSIEECNSVTSISMPPRADDSFQANSSPSTDSQIDREIEMGMKMKSSSCMNLENNDILYLSLEIMKSEDEEFIKIYEIMPWRTEKLFALLSNRALYVLFRGVDYRPFEVKDEVHFSQIDYLTVSLNYQGFAVFGFDRRNRCSLDVGDEMLTRSIISNLEVAMRKSPRSNNLPSIFTDATSQVIALKKCFSEDLKIDVQAIVLKHYVHVHWEDTLGNLGLKTLMKSGHLHVKKLSTSLLGSKITWLPIYVVLQNEELHAFKKESNNTPEWVLKLSNVKEIILNDNELELMMDNKHKVKLRAPTIEECKQWHHTLTISKSENFNMDDMKTVCIPSILAIANDELISCHEELNTGRFEIRGKCSLTILHSICLDKECPYYCILVFDSFESNNFGGDWILYFSSSKELFKFVHVVDTLWEELFQVKLMKDHITEEFLQQKCREMHKSRILL